MAAHDDGVQTIAATVTTAGRSRDVSSVDIDREIPSTGPASLPAGGGLTAATGTLTLEDPGQAVEVRRGSPWFRDRGWPPALGDPVEVDVTVDGETSRRFTGIVEDAAGSTGEPVEAAIVDPIDRLHRAYTSEPLASPMAAGIGGGLAEVVDPWLRVEHHVTRAMRAAGFHHAPPPTGDACLYIPHAGSLMPDVGALRRAPTGQTGAWTVDAPWGLALRNVLAEWTLGTPNTARPRPNAWDLTLHAARWSSTGVTRLILGRRPFDTSTSVTDFAWIEVRFPTTTTVRVRVSWDGSTTAAADAVGTYQPGQPIRVQLVDGGPSTIWHGDTVMWTGTATPVPSPTEDRLTNLRIQPLGGGGVWVGPVYLSGASTPAADLDAPLTGVLHPSPVLTGRLAATPYIERVDTLTLLRRIADATLSDMWIDREGRFHWAGVGALVAQPPTMELTATADLLDLAWEETLASMAREVTVTCDSPAVTASKAGRTLLWEGTTETLTDGETVTVWATAPAEQDWILARTPFRTSTGGGTTDSFTGGVVETEGSDVTPWATAAQLPVTVERINSQAFKVTHTAAGLSDTQTIALRTPAHSKPQLSEVPLPRIVGHGRIDWATVAHTAARRGPDAAGDYEHPAGPWVQGADCQALADWIASWVTAPGAILRELPIIYRGDIDLGQVVDVIEDAVYHIRVRAVVVGLSEHHEAGSSEMTVTLRVLALDQQPATLATYDQVWAGGTLAQRDQEWSGQSLAEFDANPLRRN